MTEVIKWRSSYETGISAMDGQHRELLEMINHLYIMIREDRKGDETEKILQQCLAYGRNHLRDEEALLVENDYPDIKEQIDAHADFVKRVNSLTGAESAAREQTAMEIYQFLRVWWLDHIVGLDKKYGEYLRNRGLR